MHTGTTEYQLEISIMVAERFGWTVFIVVVRKLTSRHVHATAGAVTTVVTTRMSLYKMYGTKNKRYYYTQVSV